MRRITRRRLEQACQHGCFRHRQVGDILVEVEFRRGRDAERAAAHVGAVEIELQDLLLRQVCLQPERQEGFLDLALDGALVGEEQVLGQLLGQRRAALHDGIGAGIFEHGTGKPDQVDAEMLEKAAVLGGQHRLDDHVGHFVDRHGIALENAALADLVAVAIEEGDGVIVLSPPVFRRFLEGRHGQRQHDHGPGSPEREAFRQQFEDAAPPAGGAEPAEEDGDVFPGFGCRELRFIQGRIDPRVDLEQPGRLGTSGFSLLERVLHVLLSTRRHGLARAAKSPLSARLHSFAFAR